MELPDNKYYILLETFDEGDHNHHDHLQEPQEDGRYTPGMVRFLTTIFHLKGQFTFKTSLVHQKELFKLINMVLLALCIEKGGGIYEGFWF